MFRAVRGSIYDEHGKQLLVLMQVNCSTKFRDIAAKELVKKLNTIRRWQKPSEQQRHGAGGINNEQ